MQRHRTASAGQIQAFGAALVSSPTRPADGATIGGVRAPLLCLSALALGAACTGVDATGAAARRVGLAAPAAQPEPAGALRVMTFNIRFGTAPDGENAWPRRRALALRVIRDFGPTVLGLQEALRFQLDELHRDLPIYGEVGVGRDDGVLAGEYAAILYDRNRLELLRDGHFWLSDSPELPGSMTWGNRYPRIVTWARFRDRATSATFLVGNTHWDHESQEARENSAHLMLHRLLPQPDAGEPVLVMGDLNCAADNPAFRRLQGHADAEPGDGAGLTDTFAALFPQGVTGSGTFHAFSGNRDGPKIDFVLVWPLRERLAPRTTRAGKEWRVLQADIVHTNDGGRYPSDHFPVTAIVMLADVAGQ